ncbi:hypothetical protein [Streptomyces antarcticus]|uniref:hypothetical protein n=1 Tax=Streptomyces antarcticus TaxID=2996458 RepID=UPI00227078AC|nr:MULTISPECIES: hypothetical protein [unclassified Streptomyces]MCY0947001.1 hypothetical protein [Streptomyces sp. H34-AA3]MCZ4088124.1 hypothetical protein [Streptomyces sp. H34-S5]
MTASLRQATDTVANSMIEGASMASALIGGAGGAYLGYQLAPAAWTDGARIAFAGAVAVVGAVAIDGLAELVLAPMRRLMRRTPLSVTRASAPAPAATLDEALAQVVVATEDDAAHRAAGAAIRIDHGDNFLGNESRWRGYEDGEASFYLAPGVVLHHRTEKSSYGHRESRFTLLTGDGEQPVAITGMEQIRHHLAARAAGLPATPATADTKDAVADTITELDTHLKALEA